MAAVMMSFTSTCNLGWTSSPWAGDACTRRADSACRRRRAEGWTQLLPDRWKAEQRAKPAAVADTA